MPFGVFVRAMEIKSLFTDNGTYSVVQDYDVFVGNEWMGSIYWTKLDDTEADVLAWVQENMYPETTRVVKGDMRVAQFGGKRKVVFQGRELSAKEVGMLFGE